MRDPVFIFRGSQADPRALLHAQIEQDAFLSDVDALLALPGDRLESAAEQLRRFDGFLSPAGLQDLFGSVFGDEGSAVATRFVVRFDDLARRFADLDGFFSALEGELRSLERPAEGRRALSAAHRSELVRWLRVLIQENQSLARQAKAQELSEALGYPLEQILLICDLRPVFDRDRATVEGMIPVTTLRIVVEGNDGLPLSLEARLSPGQLEDLVTKSTRAQQKLHALESFLRDKNITQPRTT